MTHSLGERIRRLATATPATAGGAVAAASLAVAGGALADAPTNPGTFVIGDQNVQVGSQVTFWGAQWWQDNDPRDRLEPDQQDRPGHLG
jgi:hypothetical protein